MAYIILGHGVENPINFEERAHIPEGITLVTFAECGIVTTEDEVCPMVEAFTKPEYKEILENPLVHKKQIRGFLNGKDIHIYTAGQKYPSLELQMFLDWSLEKNLKIMKSGTYKFPIDASSIQIGEGETFCDRLFKKIRPYKGAFAQELPEDYSSELMFHNSIKPTVDEVNSLIGKSREEFKENRSFAKQFIPRLKKKLRFRLEDIFSAGGPGVYYFVVCREPPNVMDPKTYVNNILQNESNKRYEPYYKANWISHIPEIIPLLDADIETLKKGWSYEEAKNLRNKYKNLAKIPGLRRKSMAQQNTRRISNKEINDYLEKWRNHFGGGSKTRKRARRGDCER